jgi:hypothetical protein
MQIKNTIHALDDTAALRRVRRDLARAHTVLHERREPTSVGSQTRQERKRACNEQYGRGKPMTYTSPEAKELAASEFVAAKRAPAHVNLTAADVSFEVLFTAQSWSTVKTLDASRLHVDDSFLIALGNSRRLDQLWWLDLSGNPDVTRRGVQSIAKGVAERRIPKLAWLNLLGTQCDATPYLDGSYWRMARSATELAKEFGAQKWMMLGSRQPQLAGREPLAPAARHVPPDRFMLA